MKVLEFNIPQGRYHFLLQQVYTEMHQHPAIEIIISESDLFSIQTQQREFHNLTCAIIDAHLPHRLMAAGEVRVYMIEFTMKAAKSWLFAHQVKIQDGIYCSQNLTDRKTVTRLVEELEILIENEFDDLRVSKIVSHLNTHVLHYDQLMPTFLKEFHLSESRLSHLFKSEMGISLKKYLVWCRLKQTIQMHLNDKEDLLTALVNSGFYDQPHFSKAFKEMLGVSPSHVYNSRTIQGLGHQSI